MGDSSAVSQVFGEFLVTVFVAAAAAVAVYLAHPHIRKLNSAWRVRISPGWANRIIWVIFFGYVFIFGALSVLQHLSFNTHGFDVGVFDQSIWNSLNGRPLELSLVYDVRTLIEQRFSPILLAFVPLYTVWDDPLVLLLVQALALATTILPIYWFARERLGHALALVFGFAFFLSPAVEFANLIEFREVALATPIFAFAMMFLLRRNDRALLVCLALLLLVKEEIGLTTCFIGIYMAAIQKRWRFGVVLALFSLGWFAALVQFVLPFFRGGSGYYYFGGGFAMGHGRYDYLGASLPEVATTILTRPDIWLPKLLIPEKLIYVLHFLVPLAFLPLIGGEVAALALPTLAPSLISTFPTQYSVASQYALPMMPFLFFAAVLGVERIFRWTERNERVDRAALHWASVALILSASVVSYLMQAPGPLAQHFQPSLYQSAFDPLNQVAYRLMQEIPDSAVVVAQSELVPHMSHRQHIWEFPYAPDYRQADYLFFDKTLPGYFASAQLWKSWFDTGYFETIKEQDGFVIARRRAPANPLDIKYGDAASLIGSTIITTDTVRGGQTLRPIVEWRPDSDIKVRYVVQVHLVDSSGHVWAKDEGEPDRGTLPTNLWRANQPLGDQYSLKLPETMPPDDYRLSIAVCDLSTGDCLPARDAAGKTLGEEPTVATVHVEKDKSSITASQVAIQAPLFVDMAEVRFLGFVPPRQSIAPGESFSLGVYWRARGKPQGDYAVSVQLRDALNQVVFENTSRPAQGKYPTTEWSVGEVLLDWHDFTLPGKLHDGNYVVYVVLRDVSTNRVLGEARIAPLSVLD